MNGLINDVKRYLLTYGVAMKRKINGIHFFPEVMLICLLVTSACNLISNHPSDIPTVFSIEQIPSGTNRLTFFRINWSWEDKLSIQGFQIGYYPGFIGDISVGNIFPLYLNNSPLDGSLPVLSRDGRYVVFQSRGKLYIAAIDKNAPNKYSITSDRYVDVLDAEYRCNHAWSPDSRQVASVCLAPGGITIGLYDLIEKQVQDIFEYIEDDIGEIEGTSWSPDATMLSFSLRYDYDDKPSQTDIFVYHLDNGSLVRITNTPGQSERNPDWYPGNQILTFTLTMQGDAESLDSRLVFSTEDGKCMRSLSNMTGVVSPSWSPDGSQLAYIADWMEIKVLDTSQFVPRNFLSQQGLCSLQ